MVDQARELAQRVYTAFSQSVQGNGDYNSAVEIAGSIIIQVLRETRAAALLEAAAIASAFSTAAFPIEYSMHYQEGHSDGLNSLEDKLRELAAMEPS